MKQHNNLQQFNSSSETEKKLRSQLTEHLRKSPIPDDQLLENFGLFLSTKDLSRLLFFSDMYNRILEVQGVIMEFGVRWGQTLAVLSALRGLYEPYNIQRRIVGFDTFEGFPDVDDQDGGHAMMSSGNLSVTPGYEEYLEKGLAVHETGNPVAHVRKFEICKGDAPESLRNYMERQPETIVSMAIFDMDIYQPTKQCLEILLPYMVRGSVLIFDELNCRTSPGETVAVREVLGLENLRIQRPRNATRVSYIIMD